MFNILVVEDDIKLCGLYCRVLSKNGYNTFPAHDGEEALRIMDSEFIDMIITDIMMPNMDGYELTKQLREANYSLPVLFITARDMYEDKYKGFLLGADDYMVKPIDVNEMVLRVGALLRRSKIISERKISFANTLLDYDSLTVTTDGKTYLLPQKEFYLLYKLISYPNKIFTRQQIMDEIWGMDSQSDDRTVAVHINRLRERFSECKDFKIETVRGLGYRAVKNN